MGDTLLTGSLSWVFIALMTGALSFFIHRFISFFTATGTGDSKRMSFPNSLPTSIGFMMTLLILGTASRISPITPKYLYLFLSIIMFREGMQITGMVKLNPIFSSVTNTRSRFKSAIFTGLLGGFLSFRMIEQVLNQVLGLMEHSKLLGIGLFVLYAVVQIALFVSLEILISIVQNTGSHHKRTVVLSGILLIVIGFIMSYFGFSYDF